MSSMRSRKTLVIGVTVNLEHYENLRLEVSGEVESMHDADDLIGYLDEVLGRLGREDLTTAGRIDSYRKRVLARADKETLPAAASGCHDGVCPLPADLLSEVVGPVSSSPATRRRTQPAPVTPPVPLSPSGGETSGGPLQGYPAPPGKPTKPLPDSPADAPGVRDQPGTEAPPGAIPRTSSRFSGISGKIPSPAGANALSSPPTLSPHPAPGTPVEGSKPLLEKEPILTPDAHKANAKGPLPPGSQACDLCSAPITEAERKTSQLFTSKNLCRTCMKKT
jgi:hypothetical protein